MDFVTINAGLIVAVSVAYTLAFVSGCRALNHARKGHDFSFADVLHTLALFTFKPRKSTPSTTSEVLFFGCLLSTAGAFLMAVLHVQYLASKDFVAIGLWDNIRWMAAHIIAAVSINAFHYATTITVENDAGE